MEWISKDPPIYIFIGDTWLRETDKSIFESNIEKGIWVCENGEMFPFTKKTKIMKSRRNDQ